MKVKLLKSIEFRGAKYKKGKIVEVPTNLGNKMILDSLAVKA